MRTLGSILVTAITLAAGVAHADPAEVHEQSIHVDLGLFSPVGELGATYTLGLDQHVAVEAGAGLGFSGVQLSLMPRLVFGGDSLRFTPGVGASVAPSFDAQTSPGVNETIMAPWLNIEPAALEWRRGGLSLTLGAGLSIAMFHDCVNNISLLAPPGCTDMFGTPLPSVRMGIGPTF